MKKTLYLLVIVCLMIFTNTVIASDENNDLQWSSSFGNKGFQIRKFVTPDKLLYLSPSYWLRKQEFDSQNFTEHDLGITIGLRHYLTKNEIKLYLETDIGIEYTARIDNEDRRQYEAAFKSGVEKNISRKISIEGSAGIALYYDQYYSRNNIFYITVPIVSIAVNYYF